MDWTLIVEPQGRRGADNMWIDDALLRAAGEGVAFLRLYRWTPACISFGRHEPARTRYDRAGIVAAGVDTVRRPTGGRAVWHERELTYAVAGPVARFGSLAATYQAIHATIADAVGALGAPATLAAPAPRVPRPGDGACFAVPVGGEVLVNGRKLVGSAQVRDGSRFLQHGSLLLAGGQERLAALTRGPAAAPAAAALGAILDRDITFAEVARAVADAARARWGGRWHEAPPPAPPSAGNPYADAAWTWRR